MIVEVVSSYIIDGLGLVTRTNVGVGNTQAYEITLMTGVIGAFT